jgi:hypothetical protein
MVKFREFLKAAPPESQRVYIWALGHSPNIKDFELLMSLRDMITDPEIMDTLVRALNRSVNEMRNRSDSPEKYPVYLLPKDAWAMMKAAVDCKERLVKLNLVVMLTMYV